MTHRVPTPTGPTAGAALRANSFIATLLALDTPAAAAAHIATLNAGQRAAALDAVLLLAWHQARHL